MARRPFNFTPLAIALQTASLLIVGSCVLGILISGVARRQSAVTNVEAPARVQLE
jgi:hypothetical protein